MYKFFKLINGENILAEVPDSEYNGSENTLNIHNPVILTIMRYPKSGYLVEAYIFSNWFAGSDTKVVTIQTSSIIASVEAKESVIEQYKLFLQYSEDSEEEILFTDDEQSSTSEEADEEEEETSESTRTIH